MDFNTIINLKKEEFKDYLDTLIDAYYNKSESLIKDYEFDKLKTVYELKYGELQLGAAPTSDFMKVSHIQPMLSLKDITTVGELTNLLGKYNLKLVWMWKYDGLSIELVYAKGKLLRLVTRGDGHTGEDVTINKDLIINLIEELPNEETVTLYGEIFVTHQHFTEINKINEVSNQKLFKNRRNYASGSMRLKDNSKKLGRKLTLAVYKTDLEFSNVKKQADFIKSTGYQYKYYEYKDSSILAEAEERRNTLTFPVDGLVIELEDYVKSRELGSTNKYPRYALAYKFNSNKATSKINSIRFDLGATGKITPVVEIEPVFLMETTITNINLYNKFIFLEYNLGYKDSVVIEKGGDIIPKIVEYTHGKLHRFTFPDNCPKCDSKLVDKNNDTYCVNSNCKGKILAKLVKFCSREGFNIKIGEKTLEKLIKTYNITKTYQLFNLSIEDFTELERFGDKSANNLYESIQNSKKIDAHKFIYALNIPRISSVQSKKLAETFSTIRELSIADYESLVEIDKIGNIIAEGILEYFSDSDNLQAIVELSMSGVELKLPKEKTLSNITYAVTGKIEGGKEALAELLEPLGAIYKKSVTKDTTYLVLGNSPGKTKLEKAKKYGIISISEREFRKLCGV